MRRRLLGLGLIAAIAVGYLAPDRDGLMQFVWFIAPEVALAFFVFRPAARSRPRVPGGTAASGGQNGFSDSQLPVP